MKTFKPKDGMSDGSVRPKMKNSERSSILNGSFDGSVRGSDGYDIPDSGLYDVPGAAGGIPIPPPPPDFLGPIEDGREY